MDESTAAVIVIGNEILSGKVTDQNAAFLSSELRLLGVDLRRILVIPDDLETIADAVRDYSARFGIVFTSGGVGPTHDDITIAGVAHGLGQRVVRHPLLEAKIREISGERLNDARLKMAEVPEGAELIFGEDRFLPLVKVKNVYILPGIPELFRAEFSSVRARFCATPFHLRAIYLSAMESTIAEFLNETLSRFPRLLLGSYPRLGDPEYRVRVTLESKDREYLEQAFKHLMAQLPVEVVIRTE